MVKEFFDFFMEEKWKYFLLERIIIVDFFYGYGIKEFGIKGVLD